MFEPEFILGLIDSTIKNNSAFGDLLTPEYKALLAQNSLVRPAAVGEVLCQQDQSSRSIFLIISGDVEISTASGDKKTVLAMRSGGDLIGEISGIFMMPHIATATVVQPSVVLEIPSEIFSSILAENGVLRNAIIDRCKKRIIETSLRYVPAFRELDQQAFNELCYISSMATAKKGDVLACEGKIERNMYVICRGVVRVYITVNGKEITIALRHPGEYFGEYSLLTGKARSASVAALSDLQLVKLEGEAFQSYIDYYEDAVTEIGDAGLNRKRNLDKLREGLTDRISAEDNLSKIQDLLV